MNDENNDQDPRHRMQELLAAGALAEIRLLKNERKAERHLAAALNTLEGDKARLRKVQQRMKRSRDSVAAARANLQDVQARRAAGPVSPQD
jgi:hypothetical protein